MGLFPTTFQDILRLLIQPLHIAAIFPATVWALFNVYFIIPLVYSAFQQETWSIPIILISIIIISYLLYVLNGTIIQIAEGYTFEWTSFGNRKKKSWQKKYDKLLEEIDICEGHCQDLENIKNLIITRHLKGELSKKGEDLSFEQILASLDNPYLILNNLQQDLKNDVLLQVQDDPEFKETRSKHTDWTRRKEVLEYQKQFYYPATRTSINPTRLGNIIASFEDYSFNRYGMDSLFLWPRLTPILQAEGYSIFIEQEKAAFDFLLNLSVISLIIGAELTFVFLLSLQVSLAALAIVLAVAVAYMFYLSSHSAARHWGGRVKSAFDLYREPLREKLCVRKPVSYNDERKLWENLSKFYRSSNSRFEDFDYYHRSLPIIVGESSHIEVSKVTVDESSVKAGYALILRNHSENSVNQVEIIDFMEKDFEPYNIVCSASASKLSYQHLDSWSNAYQWIVGPLAARATIIITYSLHPIEINNT